MLRDLEVLSGAGVPVYGVRGPGGGFELLDTFAQAAPVLPPGLIAGSGRLRRVRVRIAPAALQLALVAGSPAGRRPRPASVTVVSREDWQEGSFRFDSYDAAYAPDKPMPPIAHRCWTGPESRRYRMRRSNPREHESSHGA